MPYEEMCNLKLVKARKLFCRKEDEQGTNVIPPYLDRGMNHEYVISKIHGLF